MIQPHCKGPRTATLPTGGLASLPPRGGSSLIQAVEYVGDGTACVVDYGSGAEVREVAGLGDEKFCPVRMGGRDFAMGSEVTAQPIARMK